LSKRVWSSRIFPLQRLSKKIDEVAEKSPQQQLKATQQ
jgi:hypothetical protein